MNAAEQHRLTLARIALDPEQVALVVIVPSLEIFVIEDPAVRVPPAGHPCSVQCASCRGGDRWGVGRLGSGHPHFGLAINSFGD